MKINVLYQSQMKPVLTISKLIKANYEIAELNLINIDIESLKNLKGELIVFDTQSEMSHKDNCGLVRLIQQECAAPLLIIVSEESPAVYRQDLINEGADLCVDMTIQTKELEARINRLVYGRGQRQFTGMEVRVGKVQMSLLTKSIFANGRSIAVSQTEYKLLEQLLLAKNKLVRTESLLRNLRVKQGKEAVLKVYIWHLRQKLGSFVNIKTIPNYGYLIEE